MNSEILYERFLQFAQKCQQLMQKLQRTVYNIEYSRQLIRSSGSVGANYIEAIEGSSRNDFIHRLKICRKEAKESTHWLTLIEGSNQDISEVQLETERLVKEAREFVKIFTSSILTAEKNREIKRII